VLAVWKLDRLGRNTQHVLAAVDQLTSRGIGFRSLTEGLHTEGPMGTAVLTIMAAFAQLERDTMIERTRAGLAAAAANGRKGGRPRKVDDTDAAKALGKPMARLPRRHVGGMRQAHRQHEPPAVAGLGVTARTPAAWPSGLVVLAVDEHEPAAVARP
jgi:DNA invertase Pin-like site-specific DNA recombinase